MGLLDILIKEAKKPKAEIGQYDNTKRKYVQYKGQYGFWVTNEQGNHIFLSANDETIVFPEALKGRRMDEVSPEEFANVKHLYNNDKKNNPARKESDGYSKGPAAEMPEEKNRPDGNLYTLYKALDKSVFGGAKEDSVEDQILSYLKNFNKGVKDNTVSAVGESGWKLLVHVAQNHRAVSAKLNENGAVEEVLKAWLEAYHKALSSVFGDTIQLYHSPDSGEPNVWHFSLSAAGKESVLKAQVPVDNIVFGGLGLDEFLHNYDEMILLDEPDDVEKVEAHTELASEPPSTRE